MAPMNKEVQTRREKLLAARTECLAKMTDAGRRAFERHQKQAAAGLAKAGQRDCEVPGDSMLAREIKNLIVEAHRLRENAESKRDVRAALKGLDTALKALGLYGRATGEISNARRTDKPTVNAVATRDEGIQTATELLLQMATAEEIAQLMGRLQQRLEELHPAPLPASDGDSGDEGTVSAASLETLGCAESSLTSFDSDAANCEPTSDGK